MFNFGREVDSLFLKISKFVQSVFSPKKQFGLCLSFEALILWNNLSIDVSHPPSLASNLVSYLFRKAFLDSAIYLMSSVLRIFLLCPIDHFCGTKRYRSMRLD